MARTSKLADDQLRRKILLRVMKGANFPYACDQEDVAYATAKSYIKANPGFGEEVVWAGLVSVGKVNKKLFELALDGDTGAAKEFRAAVSGKSSAEQHSTIIQVQAGGKVEIESSSDVQDLLDRLKTRQLEQADYVESERTTGP